MSKQFDEIMQGRVSRRGFLRAAGAAAVAAGAATGAQIAAAAPQVEVEATPEPAESKGYRLTRHVADYYKSAL